jgi:hypothetical protein
LGRSPIGRIEGARQIRSAQAVKRSIQSMSVSELVEQFAELSLSQFDAELHSDIAKENKIVRRTMAIAEELKSRPGDQRSALLRLYEHSNVQVRLNAARLTLAVAPEAARQTLEDIENSKEYPQAMDAGMCLWVLDEGMFTPT